MPDNTNTSSIMRFTDEATKDEYKKLVESVLYNVYLASVSAYFMGMYHVWNSLEAPMPDKLEAQLASMFEEFPGLKEAQDPAELSEMFRPTVMNEVLNIAILVIRAVNSGKVSFKNINDVLIPLVFDADENGLELSEEELENLLSEVEHINVHNIAKA